MGLVGLVTDREPPAGRASHCDGPLERHLSEAGVMLAVAEWMFGLGAEAVEIHPDGMHVKQFDMCGWLASAGFEKVAASGKTREAGRYTRNRQSLTVDFRSGRGDVVGDVRGCRIVVEAKGGCINTRHPGQVSKLRSHLYEAVGRLLDDHAGPDRLIAAVPRHTVTESIAHRMTGRCACVGIEIALVAGDGQVEVCTPKANGASQ